jgi:acetylornithine deacetylase/succinyl-diaminopimelate desuccinylase-like protein
VTTIDQDLASYCTAHREANLDELKQWIAIPSVSADPACRGDVRACCGRLVERMRSTGLDARVLETNGNPLAFGQWLEAPGAPTVLIYGHYDVQPVDPLDLWESPPFDAQVRNGNIYGRGSVDDKGQVLMHLAAIEAHMHTRGRLPINIKVVVEGEEEIGSPNFDTALARYSDLIRADVAVISDTAVFAENIPSLTTSVRGLVHWEITVYGPTDDAHSGYYGGILANPIEALAHIIAGLKDDDGHVTVAGFYDGVPELSKEEHEELARLPFDETRQAAQLGVPELFGEAGWPALERNWFRPTLECNGIYGGYQGPGAKTIIPSFARAKISGRLVGTQDPLRVRALVTEAIKKRAPRGVRVEVESGGEVPAVVISREHPAAKAALAAMKAGFGGDPVFIGTGGSIGPVASFDRILKIPQVLIGVGLPDDHIHAPNEHFNLKQFFGGILTMAVLYDELATIGT